MLPALCLMGHQVLVLKEPSERSVLGDSKRRKAGESQRRVTYSTLGKAATENQLGGTTRTGMVDFSRGNLQCLRFKEPVISWEFWKTPVHLHTQGWGRGRYRSVVLAEQLKGRYIMSLVLLLLCFLSLLHLSQLFFSYEFNDYQVIINFQNSINYLQRCSGGVESSAF